jgi:hypothetical protein
MTLQGFFREIRISEISAENLCGMRFTRWGLLMSVASVLVLQSGIHLDNGHDTRVCAEGMRVDLLQKLRIAVGRYPSTNSANEAGLLPFGILSYGLVNLSLTQSWILFEKYLRGVEALIEHVGPKKLAGSHIKNSLYGYRAIELASSLIQR